MEGQRKKIGGGEKMSHEKLILEVLKFQLENKITDDEVYKQQIMDRLDQALNPKEDVPYEKSFVKSSKGEKKNA